ncbi:NUDIX hydrolase [Candidatus Synechococcus calcipolaris G9]|uniref:NUDIX hydrolase n=1 Tax=Candidatus Synechococcus calcipolaris G9 TaxID=1497997 RepID=A0ABT6EVU0_9SYNE|nr:NUDIX hydrolase [Candidatus Synechococcus calcipolaris]MDG2989911.1 NUDIX hydrolase [Candidatus Synechococcus calcipolaris G9]
MAHRNPAPTVDMIIELSDRPGQPIILIERKHPPLGWAIPGGFVDYGETVENAARREAKEEISLDVTLRDLLYVYSCPDRDPRQHTISIVFIGTATGTPQAADDAKHVGIFTLENLPEILCFDHGVILQDYYHYRTSGNRPNPARY